MFSPDLANTLRNCKSFANFALDNWHGGDLTGVLEVLPQELLSPLVVEICFENGSSLLGTRVRDTMALDNTTIATSTIDTTEDCAVR